MRRLLGVVCVVVLAAQVGYAQQGGASRDAGRLPVKRVVLYKNGVGFFEHVGRVSGDQQVSIDFTSGQLNDVLKSLTTVDLGGGKVTGVSFNTDDPSNRKLGALALPLDEDTTVGGFLAAIRGARVEVQAGGVVIVGRVLSVETRSAVADGKPVEVRELAVVTDGGELKPIEVTPRVSVRVLEGELKGDVQRYLDIVASTRQRDLRKMSITTTGRGDRELYVSYISEVPVWKSTYRLVMPSKAGQKPLLQGWAIVDNTIGEDWSNVELSLVAGSPQSFVQELSQPLYARRPVIPLPSAMQLAPQTHEASLAVGAAPAATPPEAEADVQAAVSAPSRLAGVMAGLPAAPSPAPAPRMAREMAEEAMQKVEAAAEGRELGDLFEYRLKEPVTIRKNQSALVPIVQGAVDAERVSVWSEATGARPRAAVWLTNTTGATLDGGAFSVLEDATFTGEGLMGPVKPGERRLLSFAADLSLLVDVKPAPEPERVTGMRVSKGVMVVQREYRDRRVYTVRSEDAKARTLVIEHPNRAGWQITNNQKPDETAPNLYRFRVAVAPKSTASLTIEERRLADVTYRVANTTDDLVALMVRQQAISPEFEQALRAVVAKKNAVAAAAADVANRNREMQQIAADQERLRENLKALGSRNEEKSLVARYTGELAKQEDRLDVLKREVVEHEARRLTLQAELDAMIEGLSFSR